MFPNLSFHIVLQPQYIRCFRGADPLDVSHDWCCTPCRECAPFGAALAWRKSGLALCHVSSPSVGWRVALGSGLVHTLGGFGAVTAVACVLSRVGLALAFYHVCPLKAYLHRSQLIWCLFARIDQIIVRITGAAGGSL